MKSLPLQSKCVAPKGPGSDANKRMNGRGKLVLKR